MRLSAILLLLAVMLVACGGRPGGSASTPAMTRDEFRAKVEGKTKAEVIEAVGKPDRTSEGGRSETWFYDGRTFDPLTGKTDRSVWVVFGRSTGKVKSIHF